MVCVSPSTMREGAGEAGSLSLLSCPALTTEVGRVARTAGEPGCVDPGRRSARMLLMRLSTSARRSRSWLRRGVGDSTCAASQSCVRATTAWAAGRAHLSEGTRRGRLSAGSGLLAAQLALSLELGELGLLCENLLAALLQRRLHGRRVECGGWAARGRCRRVRRRGRRSSARVVGSYSPLPGMAPCDKTKNGAGRVCCCCCCCCCRRALDTVAS